MENQLFNLINDLNNPILLSAQSSLKSKNKKDEKDIGQENDTNKITSLINGNNKSDLKVK